jgi:hypothetical protein
MKKNKNYKTIAKKIPTETLIDELKQREISPNHEPIWDQTNTYCTTCGKSKKEHKNNKQLKTN